MFLRNCDKALKAIIFYLCVLIFPSSLYSASDTEPLNSDEYSCPDCNVIFISITNLRADHLPVYGYNRNTAPYLTDFAKNAIVFDKAYTVSSWTLPAGISVFTSLYPFQHRVEVRKEDEKIRRLGVVSDRLSDNVRTLFDILKERGYRTASINGGGEYHPQYGLTGRADFWAFYSTRGHKDGSSFDVIPEAIRWLENNHKKKFFLQIQAFDPHCPYAYLRENNMFDPDYKGDVDFTRCYWTLDKIKPVSLTEKGVLKKYYVLNSPDEFSLRSLKYEYGKSCSEDACPPKDEFQLSERDIYHMVALYDGVIYDVDSQLNSFFSVLKKMGLLENTITVFFSEHGDSFGKNGRFMRGGALRGLFYDDVLHVPLIVYHPRLKTKRVITPVSVIDIAPSLLELLSIPIPQQFKGESFVPDIVGQEKNRKVYAGCLFVPPERNVKGYLKKFPTMKSLSSHLWGCSFMAFVRDRNMKLIKETVIVPPGISGEPAPRVDTFYELYDLAKDPEELHDVKDNLPETLKELRGDIDMWFLQSQGIEYDAFIDSLKRQILAVEISSDRGRKP